MFEAYQSSLMGLWIIMATIIIQTMAAIRAHRRQKGGYRPGIVDPSLGHSSFVFRSHRTFQNSIENAVPMLGMIFIAIISGYGAFKLSIVVWMYAIARIIHMILYYKIATEKNPSPRSIFWAIGFLTNLYYMDDLCILLVL